MDAETIVFGVMPAVSYMALAGVGLYLHFSQSKKRNIERTTKNNFGEEILNDYLRSAENNLYATSRSFGE